MDRRGGDRPIIKLDVTTPEIIFREIEKIHGRQYESLQLLNDKSIRIIEFNLVVGAFVVSAFSLISKLEVEVVFPNTLVYAFAGGLSFAYAIWCCTRSYSPTRFVHGPDVQTLSEFDVLMPRHEFYARLIASYPGYVGENDETIENKALLFQRGLFATFFGLFYITVSLIRVVLPPVHVYVDVVAAFLLLRVALVGKEIIRHDANDTEVSQR